MGQKASASEPLTTCRKSHDEIKTGLLNGPGRAGGYPLTAQVVSGMGGGASLVRAPVWNV